MSVRRLLLVLSIAFSGFLALTAAASAAGGGFGPGKFNFSSTSANATIGTPKGSSGPFVSIQVNHGYNAFKPIPANGPRVVMFDTMVSYMEFDPTTGSGGFGCFIIPDGDFTVSKDLTTATLNTTLTADEECGGVGTPVFGATNPAGFAGGGGGGLNLPITVSLTWSGNGVVSTNQDRNSFSCLKYGESSTSTFSDMPGAANGTIGGVAVSADYADVSSSEGTLDISGTPPPQCFGS